MYCLLVSASLSAMGESSADKVKVLERENAELAAQLKNLGDESIKLQEKLLERPETDALRAQVQSLLDVIQQLTTDYEQKQRELILKVATYKETVKEKDAAYARLAERTQTLATALASSDKTVFLIGH